MQKLHIKITGTLRNCYEIVTKINIILKQQGKSLIKWRKQKKCGKCFTFCEKSYTFARNHK